ncbi:MAG: hypothetical protein KatS3mg127_1786 [Silanimonas sp.]|nr:MAG: hypothetical protein KatS3mg127_1786 [Silanimonas sp.]
MSGLAPRSSQRGSAPSRRGDHPEPHADVGLAGRRVALAHHLGAVGIDLEALAHRHRRLVDTGKRDRTVVGRPPVAGVAAHLLVGHELGHAIADHLAAVVGELQLATARHLHHPEVAAADEADEAPLRRDLRVGGEALAGGELAGAGLGGGQIEQVELAAQRKEQAARIREPGVFDDAGERGGALALTPRLSPRRRARPHPRAARPANRPADRRGRRPRHRPRGRAGCGSPPCRAGS